LPWFLSGESALAGFFRASQHLQPPAVEECLKFLPVLTKLFENKRSKYLSSMGQQNGNLESL